MPSLQTRLSKQRGLHTIDMHTAVNQEQQCWRRQVGADGAIHGTAIIYLQPVPILGRLRVSRTPQILFATLVMLELMSGILRKLYVRTGHLTWHAIFSAVWAMILLSGYFRLLQNAQDMSA